MLPCKAVRQGTKLINCRRYLSGPAAVTGQSLTRWCGPPQIGQPGLLFVLGLFFALPWAWVSDGRFCEVDPSGIAPAVADIADNEVVVGIAFGWEPFLGCDKGSCVGAVC